MKKIQAYRCEYCGKLYLKRCACLEHEAHRCSRNPDNRPLCYDCKYYQPSVEADKKERISYFTNTPWGDVESCKKFDPNRCAITNQKLYNNIKLSDEITDALNEADYRAMPLPKDGCRLFDSMTDNDKQKTDKLIFR